ncbi:C40 family peptidase [Nocardia sp. alder85J]|uniref:C40 family peptidase n=1 Tax=Nocardia sp. alder85J TaxID=2862949 RepID=UPI001CD27C89|nr:NlpC/P60 family protein [Nocardia sp. alder85J]MCX4092170.1 NlpC/P60 family protein [Nocardia sp. alder85J]
MQNDSVDRGSGAPLTGTSDVDTGAGDAPVDGSVAAAGDPLIAKDSGKSGSVDAARDPGVAGGPTGVGVAETAASTAAQPGEGTGNKRVTAAGTGTGTAAASSGSGRVVDSAPVATAAPAANDYATPVAGRVAPAATAPDAGSRGTPSASAAAAPPNTAAQNMLGMLPMLAAAMSGLGSGKGSGSGSTPQQARQALQNLADTHGNGDPTAPRTGGVTTVPGTGTTSAGAAPSGSSAASALNAKQIYQRSVSTAFGNLDNKLVDYINELGGVTTANRSAVNGLLGEVNTALSQVGPDATSVAGQYRVHALLATALHDAQVITGNTGVSAADAASAINELTRQYVYNVSGRDYQAEVNVPAASSAASSAAQRAISTALSELGKPYVYGAEGPNSFDCSGLTQYSAASAGVAIPRTASQQYQQLPKVNPADIRPGDLIFPAAEFDNGSPGHVMMYIGNGRCIEAPHTGDVVKIVGLPSSFAASRWS